MEYVEDKFGIRFNLIAGSMIAGDLRLFEVKSVTWHMGKKVEYELIDYKVEKGWLRIINNSPDNLQKIKSSNNSSVLTIEAKVLHEQFKKNILFHL